MVYLSRRVEELVHKNLDLVKEYGVDVRVELVTDQLLYMLLYLRPKLLIVADQQLQQAPNKPGTDKGIILNPLELNSITVFPALYNCDINAGLLDLGFAADWLSF